VQALGLFFLSYHHNKFIVLGCNIQAKLFGNTGRLITGCSSFCTLEMRRHKDVVWEPVEGDKCGRCSSNGCCQAKIPLYYPLYDVKLKRLDWHDDDIDQVMQNLVLIGDRRRAGSKRFGARWLKEQMPPVSKGSDSEGHRRIYR